ncbi:Imm21 family immunity protein [Dactylosporangium sp. NPDC000521]|uniref:Imm21 family immunity protein n=1 Tax=Dactylosporangium sp. NPDC000521 TaxID=3363975 RepID=UPI0036BAB767
MHCRGLTRSIREVEPLPCTWVSSAGGPLLVAPQSALSLWTGAASTDGPVEDWGTTARIRAGAGEPPRHRSGAERIPGPGDVPRRW